MLAFTSTWTFERGRFSSAFIIVMSTSVSSLGETVIVLSIFPFLSCLIGDTPCLLSRDIRSGGIGLIALFSFLTLSEARGEFLFCLRLTLGDLGCTEACFYICYGFCCNNACLIIAVAGVSISFLSKADPGIIF